MSINLVGLEEIPPVVTVSVSLPFEDMYRAEYPRLVAVATALTGTARDGEDIVQDTMVKAFIRWPRVQQLDRPGAWCLRVLVNACRSLRRRHRSAEQFRSRMRVGEPTVDGPSADVLVFWEVVRSLPSRPRTAVALYFAGNRTLAEVAAILGVPEGTVHSDIARARVLIMDALRGE